MNETAGADFISEDDCKPTRSGQPTGPAFTSEAATTSRSKPSTHQTNELTSLVAKVKERERKDIQRQKISRMQHLKKKAEEEFIARLSNSTEYNVVSERIRQEYELAIENVESDSEAEFKTNIDKIVTNDNYKSLQKKPRPRDLIKG